MLSAKFASFTMFSVFSFPRSLHDPIIPLSPQPSLLPSKIPLPNKPTEASAANANGAALFTRAWLLSGALVFASKNEVI